MLQNLHLYNFSNDFELPSSLGRDGAFLLKTCQRTLVLSYEVDLFGHLQIHDKYESHRAESAYSFLLETICGLKSKLLGENEIVSQFKEAYKNYIAHNSRNSQLMRILEKLFKDSKDIRSQYLIGISQKTYASITRKILVQKHKALKILIIGSGNLSEDLINQFKKKCPVYLSARNVGRVKELSELHDLETVDWLDLEQYSEFSHIVNTIGANITLFGPEFFDNWSEKTHETRGFIDLGSPSVIKTFLDKENGVYRLDNIFSEGAIHENQKKSKIKMASKAIDSVVEKRSLLLNKSLLQGDKFVQV